MRTSTQVWRRQGTRPGEKGVREGEMREGGRRREGVAWSDFDLSLHLANPETLILT
jgi:hypothetical protein